MDAQQPVPGIAGKVVLVTGGARGIGAEVARDVARCGGLVAVVYRESSEAAQAVVAGIRAAGGEAASFAADIGERGQADAVVAAVERQLGPVDALVHAAAVMGNGGFLDLTEADWTWMLRNDLTAVVSACRAVLPGMLERGGGSIVTFSSRLAVTGSGDAAHYAAAKAAVVSLTRSLALEFGPRGIRVNAVSPGTTDTDMGRHVIESDAGRARAANIPIRRFVTVPEVAAAVRFLLSDAAAGITGQTLHVNGGELMT